MTRTLLSEDSTVECLHFMPGLLTNDRLSVWVDRLCVHIDHVFVALHVHVYQFMCMCSSSCVCVASCVYVATYTHAACTHEMIHHVYMYTYTNEMMNHVYM